MNEDLRKVYMLVSARKDQARIYYDQLEKRVGEKPLPRTMLDLEAAGGALTAYTNVLLDIEAFMKNNG